MRGKEIERARIFAIEAHGTQQYGDYPYVKHLDNVSSVLLRFGVSRSDGERYHVAAYLHDVPEDTAVSVEQITKEFGPWVGKVVARLTSPQGVNRREKALRKLPAIGKSLDSQIVALADRIANIEMGYRHDPGKVKMYTGEYSVFKRLVHREHVKTSAMWQYLDALLAVDANALDAIAHVKRLEVEQPKLATDDTFPAL